MLRLYDFLESGNGYKVRLVLTELGLPFERIERDILKGETRTPEFLAKNPNGRIPTLELDDGTHPAESEAILWYLAEGTRCAPADRLERARPLQWQFFEQYSHEPYIAVARFWAIAGITPPDAEREAKQRGGTARVRALDAHRAGVPCRVGAPSRVRDIALSPSTPAAPVGKSHPERYTPINACLERVA